MYTVKLSSCGNIDHGQDPNQSMYGVPNATHKAFNIDQCQCLVRTYIEKYNLGAGNWTGGQVYDEDGNLVGKISYNGRFWKEKE